jgi:hypothetical protein
MQPIPETVQLLDALRDAGGSDLEPALRRFAEAVADIVPSCVGVSVGMLHHGLTFTLVSTAQRAAVLDSVQYVAGGPCVDSGVEQVELVVDDVLDERRWQQFAVSAAAAGIRSSASMPLRWPGLERASLNIYAAEHDAFSRTVLQALRSVVGRGVQDAVQNADLSFWTRGEAERAPERLAARSAVEQAVGIVIARDGVSAETARRRLEDAARRAGVEVVDVARALVGDLDQGEP